MGPTSVQDKQKVQRRRGKAEQATAAMGRLQARAASAAREDDRAARKRKDLESSLTTAQKSVKKLSKQLDRAKLTAKSTKKARREVDRDLAKQQSRAEAQLAKLAKVKAAAATDEAATKLEAGEPAAALRTVQQPASPMGSATGSATKRAATSRAPAKRSPAKRTTVRKATAKKTPARKTTARKTTAKKTTARKTASRRP